MEHIHEYDSDDEHSEKKGHFDLGKYLKEKRPTLSASSLKTYSSILGSLYRKVYGDESIEVNKFDDAPKIIEHLKDLSPGRRKTILSALVVVTSNKKYRDLMMDDILKYDASMEKNEKSDKEKDSWVEGNEIKELWEKLKDEADYLYKKKAHTMNDLQKIQNFVLISVLGGLFCPPRRSLDFCAFKVRNVDKEKDNYLEKSDLVFNKYKTCKTYNQQLVKIPASLKLILNRWIRLTTNDYLFFDSNGSPLTSVKLNQRLTKLFGKNSSVNAIRHSYISEKYQPEIEIQNEMKNVARSMGTSPHLIQSVYLKKDS